MGDKKYRGDYKIVKHIDPGTGKEERRAVYTGEYFSLNVDERRKRLCALSLAGCFALGLSGFLLAGLVNSTAAHTLLISMPHMFTMLSTVFLGVCALRIWRLGERFTRKAKDQALQTARTASWTQTVLSGVALLGDLWVALTGRGSPSEGAALCGFALMLGAGLLSLFFMKGVSARMVDKGL